MTAAVSPTRVLTAFDQQVLRMTGTPAKDVCTALGITMKQLAEARQRIAETLNARQAEPKPEAKRAARSRAAPAKPKADVPTIQEQTRVETKIDGLMAQLRELQDIRAQIANGHTTHCPTCSAAFKRATVETALSTIDSAVATCEIDLEYFQQRLEQLCDPERTRGLAVVAGGLGPGEESPWLEE